MAHIDEIVWGTTPGAKAGEEEKATAANGDNKVNGIFFDRVGQTETENVGGNRVWPG